MSSTETQIKNNAILSAGNTKPTRGTKIAGKNAAVIFYFIEFFIYKLILEIVYENWL